MQSTLTQPNNQPKKSLLIRDANPGDTEALTYLINALGYHTSETEMSSRLNGIFNHPDYKTLVAVLDDEVVGMAGMMRGIFYEKNGSYMRILVFVVKHNIRKQGIGKRLLAAAEHWAVGEGLTSSLLTSRLIDDRKAAYAFYQNAGYEIKSSGFVKQL